MEHFSENSSDYLKFRPDYPDSLFEYLVSIVKERKIAWDCGTGNGQAAVKLADYFEKIIATDINQSQLDVAIQKSNIEYYCCPAEKTEIETNSIDLITVAQALHWFNFEKFYCEVNRVLKSNGVFAAWCYSLGKMDNEVDVIINKFYNDILGDRYWAKERKYIDEEYNTIPFPFTKLTTPNFTIEKQMNFNALVGYLSTWSAVKEYQKQNQKNPLSLIFTDLQKAWGDLDVQHVMYWPIHLLVGTKNQL